MEGQQEGRGGAVVVGHVAGHVAHVDAQADPGRLVAHRVHAVDRRPGHRRVTQVADEVLGAGVLPQRFLAVEDPDAGAARHQLVDDVRPDEAGPAGDQDPHGELGSSAARRCPLIRPAGGGGR